MTDKLYYIIQFFKGVPKLKMSKLSIKSKSKSNPLRYVINESKNKKIFLYFHPMVWVISNGVADTSLFV